MCAQQKSVTKKTTSKKASVKTSTTVNEKTSSKGRKKQVELPEEVVVQEENSAEEIKAVEENVAEVKKYEKGVNTNAKALFGVIGDVKDPETVYRLMKGISGKTDIDVDDVNAHAEAMGKLYFKDSGQEVSNNDGERTARYKIVETGLKDKYTGDSVYASFTRAKFGWSGTYIGTIETLKNKMNEFWNNSICNNEAKEQNAYDEAEDEEASEKEIETEVEQDGYLKDLYDILLKKENWIVARPDGKSRLENYLSALQSKVRVLMASNCGNGYIINCSSDKIVYNTGLFDTYMNDIYIMCSIYEHKNEIRMYEHELVSSKPQLITAGFSREDVKMLPKPLTFYKNVSELIMSADIDDFDLSNRSRIDHIIDERKYRFPEQWQAASKDEIFGRIETAVENSLKMQSRDYKYIVPMYNIERDEIQYLMPLHLSKKLNEVPELVMIVSKNGEFYNLMTIISASDAYDNARVIASLDSKWLCIE